MKYLDTMKIKILNFQPENIFIIIGLIYGLAFLFITPPLYVIPDEGAQFYKAIGLNQGYIIPEKNGYEAGVYVPQNMIETVKNTFNYRLTVNNISYDSGNHNTTLKFVDLSMLAVVTYSPVPYLMPVIALKIAAIFNTSSFATIYLARFANFFIWFILVYFAIRTIPVHKWVLLMLALMPMTLFEATSISADSLTIALSFLFIACTLRLALRDQNLSRINFLTVFILGFVLTLTKSIYSILLLLFLSIPVKNFVNYKEKYGAFLILFIPSIIASLYWVSLTNHFYRSVIPNWSLIQQINFIEQNPLKFLLLFPVTFLNSWQSYLCSFTGFIYPKEWFGDITLPLLISSFYFAVLVLVSLYDKGEVTINLKQKFVFITVILIFSLALMTFEFLTWNPVGSSIINGVQGRYLIPIAPLFFLLFYNQSKYLLKKKFPFKINYSFKLLVLSTITGILTFLLVIVFKFYY
jgi:uncharacterized membrane protein